MRKRFLTALSVLSCVAFAMPSFANWQYPGTYVGDGWYSDDGSRFVLSMRGGASYSMGGIKNDVGSLTSGYFYNPTTDLLISESYYNSLGSAERAEYEYAGLGNLADLPPAKDYSSFSFVAGGSIGVTIPNRPQWRVELGWDHITEAEYNASPLFEGELALSGGDVQGITVYAESGAVQSKISTDIISAMAFYDFFDGLQKPLQTMIPYIGFGIGYADTKTTMNLADLYGDLSTSVDLQNFGELVEYGNDTYVLQFYKSETKTSTIAGLIAFGVSYGISSELFMDIGARVAYIPRVKWALTNKDDTRQRDWFSAENMIYVNATVGLRFEF